MFVYASYIPLHACYSLCETESSYVYIASLYACMLGGKLSTIGHAQPIVRTIFLWSYSENHTSYSHDRAIYTCFFIMHIGTWRHMPPVFKF